MRALALEHLQADPIGIFGEVLMERGVGVDRVMLYAGEPLPDWREYDLIVAMGAGVSVWQEEEFPWIRTEKRAVRDAVLAGLPYFGVCFGVQLLADAFGADSFQGPEPEIGVNQVFLTAAARHDPVFRGFPADLEVCEWHSNHFSLPRGAVRLARSPRYENQAIRYGRVAYGIQCHLEPSLADIRAWLEEFPDSAVTFEQRHGEGSVEHLLEEYGDFVPFLQETARQVFGRWLENALALGSLGRDRGPLRRSASGVSGTLVGRDVELTRIDAAIGAARRGEGAVLVLRGEAGIGKTALLDAAGERARGLRVLRCGGTETAETEEPFAALADLCRPLADRLELLSPARAGAAAAILQPRAGTGLPDRFAAYAGAFDLLVASAAQTPLLVLVDDAHLLDDTSWEAVAFIARRLGTDGITLLVATESQDDLPESEEIQLAGLAPPEARALLERLPPGELDPDVADQLVAAADGNPLALLELPTELTPAQRAGTVAIDGSLPRSAEWAFLRRVAELDAPARQALLVLALAGDQHGDAAARAWQTLGLDADALAAAQGNGLIRREDGRPSFRHPLVRIAVMYSALRADRRAAHAALATALGGEAGTWHRARAAASPQEPIAADLARDAAGLRDVGAFAAAARGLELAARLTPDGEARAARLLQAAQAAHLAGNINAALDHVGAALRDTIGDPVRRDAEHLRGRIIARSGSASLARDQLVAVSARCERERPDLAAEMLADAVLPALRAGGPAEAVRIARRAARLAGESGGPAEPPAQVALGTALIFAGEYAEGAALIDAADLRARGETAAADHRRRASLGAGLALAGRHASARRVLGELVDDARAAGAVSAIPYALIRLADVELETGRWSAAAAALHEARRLARETGQVADYGLALGALAWLEAARGHEDECRSHVEEALELAERLGSGSRLDRAATALALLELGRGQAAAAIGPLEDACRLQDDHGWSDAGRTPHRRSDLVEAYALAGRRDDAEAALEQFRLEAEGTQRPSALAAAARGQGLLADPEHIDAPFERALAVAGDAAGPFERARTELLYGTRLLDADRPQDAARILSGALPTFERLAAEPWAERARAGILAAGADLPEPRVSLTERLSPRELEVALAAAQGGSSLEVAERLFLGPRTVALQLASASIKLGLDSPAELAEVIRHES